VRGKDKTKIDQNTFIFYFLLGKQSQLRERSFSPFHLSILFFFFRILSKFLEGAFACPLTLLLLLSFLFFHVLLFTLFDTFLTYNMAEGGGGGLSPFLLLSLLSLPSRHWSGVCFSVSFFPFLDFRLSFYSFIYSFSAFALLGKHSVLESYVLLSLPFFIPTKSLSNHRDRQTTGERGREGGREGCLSQPRPSHERGHRQPHLPADHLHHLSRSLLVQSQVVGRDGQGGVCQGEEQAGTPAKSFVA